MHLNLVFSSLSVSEVTEIISESYTFRKSVSEYLLKNKTKQRDNGKKQFESLKETILKEIPDCNNGDKIAAIKYFRTFTFSPALKKHLKKLGIMDNEDYIGLAQAKRFIESI
jgi:hypothetical protein